MELIQQVAKDLKLSTKQVEVVLGLLADNATVPFIARYRKEATNNLDEEQIRLIEQHYQYSLQLQKRKEDIIRLIAQQDKLSAELEAEINAASKLSVLEELYRPYAQKKKTRATTAISLGLEPLANSIVKQEKFEINAYLSDKVKDEATALQMAQDIIAERFSDELKIRESLRHSIYNYGFIQCELKDQSLDEHGVFEKYYDYQEKITSLKAHRIMAIDRGEKLGVIKVKLSFNQDNAIEYYLRPIKRKYREPYLTYMTKAYEDGFKRLLLPSIERSVRVLLSDKAHLQSIELFSTNLEQILLQAPIKGKRVLGFDPAYRTGCKLAALDENGNLLKIDVIYPTTSNDQSKDTKKLVDLIKTYKIDIVAIGNGTASRESEQFVAKVINEAKLNCVYTIVSESGASVYSASKLAKEEFPDLSVEQRSAISIGRRIQDPLSELIKIDPQAIGVGQYQHDLNATKLKERLDFVVLKSVNRVGCNVNAASPQLLSHVSGISKSVANNIIDYRTSNGYFTKREQLKKVKGLGPKAYEQAAGFLRIVNGDNLFDQTSLHPENYAVAKQIMKDYKLSFKDEKITSLDREQIMVKYGIDKYVLDDIIKAFKLDIRDYRENYSAPVLRSDILKIEDLKIEDRLEGVVRNIVDFGIFVDIGLKSDGLVHISKMPKCTHPANLYAIGDIIKVRVIGIDLNKGKVQLSTVFKEGE